MAIIEVGKVFSEWKSGQPEGAHFNIMQGQYRLTLVFGNLIQKEIDEVRQARIEFRFKTTMHGEIMVIWLLFKIGDMGWSDAPYSIYMVPAERRTLPEDVEHGQFCWARFSLKLKPYDVGILGNWILTKYILWSILST